MDRKSLKSIKAETSNPPSNPGWKAKFLSERSLTVILGVFCILSVVFALWALHRSGVTMKRIDSMNHTLADLVVKRQEDSPRISIATVPKPGCIEDIPISIQQSVQGLRVHTQELSKAQEERKKQFDQVIVSQQNEIETAANLGEIKTKLRETMSEIGLETSKAKHDIHIMKMEMRQTEDFVPKDTFEKPPMYPSQDMSKMYPEEECEIDQDELKRDLELLGLGMPKNLKPSKPRVSFPSLSKPVKVVEEECVIDEDEMLRDLELLGCK